MDMNISKYQAFVAAADYGSFTKAAEVLNYTQSAISRMINDLEREWGILLLERGKGGVRLTSDGLKLLPGARRLCDEYRSFQMQVDELNGLDAGIIRIGVFSSVAAHWLPNIIKEFQKDYPNIDYELLLGDYEEIEERVNEGRIDCGFIRLPSKKGLETVFLEQDSFAAVVPEGHYLAQKEKILAADLCQEPFLMLENGSSSEVAEMFRKCGHAPKVHFCTWDDYAIMSMVEKGLGISLLPGLILKRNPYKVAVRELDFPFCRSIGFAVRSKRTMSAAVKKFSEYLKFRNI